MIVGVFWHGPRSMVQGAWSKGYGPIGPYGPIVIGLLVLLLLGQWWSKGEWSKGAWSKYYSGGNCANSVICKLYLNAAASSRGGDGPGARGGMRS